MSPLRSAMAYQGHGYGRQARMLVVLSVLCLICTLAFIYSKEFLDHGPGCRKIAAFGPRSDALSSPRQRWNDDELLVIYNRVPKAASTSVMGVTYELLETNKFHAILFQDDWRRNHVMTIADQAKFLSDLTNWKHQKPAIYHGHMAFIDFSKFGVTNPVYINVVREPLERFLSHYYFVRYGDDYEFHPDPSTTIKYFERNETFDECAKRGGVDCNVSKLWLQVPLFCGYAYECWTPGSRWALEKAKENLLNHYLVVGTTEELLEFIAVLEETLPRFFKGATKVWLTGNKSRLRKTVKKIPPSEKVIEQIKASEIWKLENEFYEFAKAQFRFIKERIFDPHAFLELNAGGGGGAETIRLPVARETGLRYDKIDRPLYGA